MSKIEVFYPGFVKKALTFTIDDGNLTYDGMLLDILKPAGIKGTFNLCSNINKGKEELLREFYSGYGIANHCKYHPLVNTDADDLLICNDKFDPESADKRYLYRVDGSEDFYWQMQPNGWRQMVFENEYIRFVEDGLTELNEIFGEGAVKDYVWPYREIDNSAVKECIYSTHRSARRTGCTFAADGFSIPKNKLSWSYNADHTNLLRVMEEYEDYPDDGELKFFAFGVHSKDFETAGRWDDLRLFAEKYGNRPDVFWYASVGEIFDYEEAVGLLEERDGTLINRSEITLYLRINGSDTPLAPQKSVHI